VRRVAEKLTSGGHVARDHGARRHGDSRDGRGDHRGHGDGGNHAGSRRSLDLTVGDLGDGLDAVLRNSGDGTSHDGNGGDGETHVDDVRW
jgi:hypothetical protein